MECQPHVNFVDKLLLLSDQDLCYFFKPNLLLQLEISNYVCSEMTRSIRYAVLMLQVVCDKKWHLLLIVPMFQVQ